MTMKEAESAIQEFTATVVRDQLVEIDRAAQIEVRRIKKVLDQLSRRLDTIEESAN